MQARRSSQNNRQKNDDPPDWNAESEIDDARGKFNLKRRYWKAVHNLGKNAAETSGEEVRQRRQENKDLYKQWVEVDNEEKLKDIIFPTWKRSSYAYRRSTLNANVGALDDAVLNMKKLHGKVMWEKKKKMDAYDKLEKQYNNMKTVEERTQKEMEKDETAQKIKKIDNEVTLIQTKIDHSETVHKNYKKLIQVIKKGNELMSRKCDYLECAAERVHKERWELYQIKTMADYLKEDAQTEQEHRRDEVIKNRSKYDKNVSAIKEDIQRQTLSESLLARIQGLDDQEKELANKALKLLGKGMVKQTIVDRAKGPDAHKGPRLRKLAFKIIRMKYEENCNAKMEQTLRQYGDLQACSCAETIDGIMLAFKEQKDTTLYLRNVSGLLQTKWMQMVKQREDLNEHVDNMIADFSHAIDKFDEDGKKRHEELHNELTRKTDLRHDSNESGQLVARLNGALKSLLSDILTFHAKPKVGELKKNSLVDMGEQVKQKRSQDSACYMAPDLEQTGNPLDLIPAIMDEMDKLKAFLESISKSRRAMLETRTKEHHASFQTFLENAIYGSAHITRTSSDVSVASISNKKDSLAGDQGDKDGNHVYSREEMKELSEEGVIYCKNKFNIRDAEEAKPKGNYHKYC